MSTFEVQAEKESVKEAEKESESEPEKVDALGSDKGENLK